MSTNPDTTTGEAPATTPPAKPAAAAPEKPASEIPADMRRRLLGGRLPTAEEATAKDKLDKDATDKAAAEKAAADKKTADEAAAAAPKAKDEKKKPKAGPKLPDPVAQASPSVEEAVRQALAEKAEPEALKLSPDIMQEVELGRFAESVEPKYAGMGKKIQDFYVEAMRLQATKEKELGGARSPEYLEWKENDFKTWQQQNTPRFEPGDKTKFKEQAIAARAEADAMRKIEPKLKKLEQQNLEIQKAPQITQRVNEALVHVIWKDPENDPALQEFVKDMKGFSERHPEEARVIAQKSSEYATRVSTVYRVEEGLEPTDPESVKWIQNFMSARNREMAERNPNGLDMGDGKILVDFGTYELHKLHKNPKYRTWNAVEMAGMIAAEGNAELHKKLRERREGVTKSIYAKPPSLPPPNTQDGQEKPKAEPHRSPEAETSRAGSPRAGGANERPYFAKYLSGR